MNQFFDDVSDRVRDIERARADGNPIQWHSAAPPAKTFAEAAELVAQWLVGAAPRPHPEQLARALAGAAETVDDLHAAVATHPRVVENCPQILRANRREVQKVFC